MLGIAIETLPNPLPITIPILLPFLPFAPSLPTAPLYNCSKTELMAKSTLKVVSPSATHCFQVHFYISKTQTHQIGHINQRRFGND